jgi:hypothetical protein
MTDSLAKLGEKLASALSMGDIPADAEIIVGRLLRQTTALQRIANLPLAQGHKKPDPHVRARRIAVAALGGKQHAIKTVK